MLWLMPSLFLRRAWTIFRLQAGASVAIYIWVWFVFWVCLLWQMICDKWHSEYRAFTSTNYGISHHCMNTVLKLRASTCNLYILFKTLFCSCSNFFLYYFKKITKFHAQIVSCCVDCVNTRCCHRRSFTHFYSLLKWHVKPCVHQWPTVCLLIFISWYNVHGHY